MSPSVDRPVFAAGLLAASMLIMSFVDNLVRVVSDDLTVWQFHLFRALFALPILALGVWIIDGQTIRHRRPLWVCLRSAVMAVSMLFFFASIPMLPMAQATAGLFTAPLFVLVLSALVLGERVGRRRVGAVLVGFAGVLIILQPHRGSIEWMGIMPVIAGAFYAVSVLITRHKCRDEAPFALVFANFCAFALMGLAGIAALAVFPPGEAERAAAAFLFADWATPPADTLAVMAGLALGAVIGIVGLTRAYQLAESSFLTLFDYTHLLGASFFAYLLWDEVPPPESILGVAMIIGAGLYLAMQGHSEKVAPIRA